MLALAGIVERRDHRFRVQFLEQVMTVLQTSRSIRHEQPLCFLLLCGDLLKLGFDVLRCHFVAQALSLLGRLDHVQLGRKLLSFQRSLELSLGLQDQGCVPLNQVPQFDLLEHL